VADWYDPPAMRDLRIYGMRIYGKNRLLGLLVAWLKRQMGGKARAGRSAGGDTSVLSPKRKEDRELSDERILGSGDFACPVKCLPRSMLFRFI